MERRKVELVDDTSQTKAAPRDQDRVQPGIVQCRLQLRPTLLVCPRQVTLASGCEIAGNSQLKWAEPGKSTLELFGVKWT